MEFPTLGICSSCDKEARLIDVGAFDFTAFCAKCVERYGARELREVSNAALAIREAPKRPKVCLRCSAPLVQGSRPMCSNCNEVYRATFGSEVRWQ